MTAQKAESPAGVCSSAPGALSGVKPIRTKGLFASEASLTPGSLNFPTSPFLVTQRPFTAPSGQIVSDSHWWGARVQSVCGPSTSLLSLFLLDMPVSVPIHPSLLGQRQNGSRQAQQPLPREALLSGHRAGAQGPISSFLCLTKVQQSCVSSHHFLLIWVGPREGSLISLSLPCLCRFHTSNSPAGIHSFIDCSPQLAGPTH